MMPYLRGFIALAALLVSTSYYLIAVNNSGRGGTDEETNFVDKDCVKDYEVDYLKLSTMYTNGYCAARNDCVGGQRPLTSIHGLWFQFMGEYKGKRPNCCTTYTYDTAQLTPLKEKLKRSWITLLRNTDDKFREEQWRDHGICGYNIYGLKSPYEYFKVALTIFGGLDFETILRRGGIVPSDTKNYGISDLYQAFKITGFETEFVCKPSKKTGRMVLTEIRTCHHKVSPFRQKNCPTMGDTCYGSITLPTS